MSPSCCLSVWQEIWLVAEDAADGLGATDSAAPQRLASWTSGGAKEGTKEGRGEGNQREFESIADRMLGSPGRMQVSYHFCSVAACQQCPGMTRHFLRHLDRPRWKNIQLRSGGRIPIAQYTHSSRPPAAFPLCPVVNTHTSTLTYTEVHPKRYSKYITKKINLKSCHTGWIHKLSTSSLTLCLHFHLGHTAISSVASPEPKSSRRLRSRMENTAMTDRSLNINARNQRNVTHAHGLAQSARLMSGGWESVNREEKKHISTSRVSPSSSVHLMEVVGVLIVRIGQLWM